MTDKSAFHIPKIENPICDEENIALRQNIR